MENPGKTACAAMDIAQCDLAPECELYASQTEDVRCRQLKVCSPLIEQTPTGQLQAEFKAGNDDEIAIVGSVSLKYLNSDPDTDVTLEARLSLNTESFVIEAPTADLTIRDNGRKIQTCYKGIDCVLDAGGNLPPRLTFEMSGKSEDLFTTCGQDVAPKAGITKIVGLEVKRSPCFQWYLANKCPQPGDGTPRKNFDFSGAVGSVLVPTAPRVSTALFTLPIFPIDASKGKKIVVMSEGEDAVIACQDVLEYRSRVYFDPDEIGSNRALTRGIAITNANAEDGRFEYKLGSSPWKAVPADTERSKALFLQAAPENRVRFLVDEGFAGKVTCKECPEIEGKRDGICVPCQLNSTGGALDFVAWDGSDGRPDGSIGDATIPFDSKKNKALVSVSTDATKVLFDVVPTVVDTSAIGARYEIAYSVRDDAGNDDSGTKQGNPVTRYTAVVDEEIPQLGLRGEPNMKIEGGIPYIDPGVFAYDKADMDITSSVLVKKIVVETEGTTELAPDYSQECKKLPGRDPRRTNCDKCVKRTADKWRHGQVCEAYKIDPEATAANCPILEQFGIVTTQGNCQNQNSDIQRLSTYKPKGTKYLVQYEAQDSQGNKKTIDRSVTIVDNAAPRVIPSLSTSEYEYVAIEYTRDTTQKYDSLARCPNDFDCTQSWLHYEASEINNIGCFMSFDAIDGDLTCRAKYTVRSFPPNRTWYPGVPGKRYGPVFRPDDRKCIGRVAYDVPLDGNAKILVDEDQLDCSEEAISIESMEQWNTEGLQMLDASAELGTRYLITYEVEDLAKHKAEVSLLYVVADTTAPAIQYGESERHIPFGFPFTAIDRKSDVTLQDIHDDCDLERGICRVISVGEQVNTVKPGEYWISYRARDQLNNEKVYNRSIVVDPFVLELPEDKEAVEMTLLIKRFSQKTFNTVEVHTAFHSAVVNTLAKKQTSPQMEYLNPNLYQGDVSHVQTDGNAIVGDFKVSFKLFVHCGMGNRTVEILNGKYDLEFANSVEEEMRKAGAIPAETKIQIINPAESVDHPGTFCSGNMEIVGAGLCPQPDLKNVPESELVKYKPKRTTGVTSQLECMTKCHTKPTCTFAAYDGNSVCITYEGATTLSCTPSPDSTINGYLTYRHVGDGFNELQATSDNANFKSTYLSPQVPGKGWVAAVIIPILIILIVVPLVIIRRRRLKEEEAEIDKLIAQAMEEYGEIGPGGSGPPRARGGYLPGASGRLDDIYGDAADDMRNKLQKARAGIGAWDKSPKFAEDPDAPALPSKAGASSNGSNDDDMYEREPSNAPPRPSKGPSSAVLGQVPAGEAARRLKQGKIPEKMFLHGALSRSDAEGLIKAAGFVDGTFLVRTKGGSFVLSMCKDSQFEHHTLSRTSDYFELNSKPMLRAQCATLSDVIFHLSKDREEIANELVTPVTPAGYVFEDTGRSRRASGRYGRGSGEGDSAFLHGVLSRGEAEGLIKAAGCADGTFLVRTKGEDFVLSMCRDNLFEHHKLSCNSGGIFELNSKPMLRAQCSTLAEVVQHLSKDREEMATELAWPVPSSSVSEGAPPPVPSKPDRRASGRYGSESSSAGFAPGNAMAENAFLHGVLSRGEAEGLIKAAGCADGMFLVRTKGESFVLSMCKDSQFEHHTLSRNSGGIFELNNKPMLRAQCSTLAEVVQHLSKDREEIATELTSPVSDDDSAAF
jgi:hypothetical protein